MKVVINSCYGGFSLSPAAVLWLFDRGCTAIATPVAEYFTGDPESSYGINKTLAEWRDYLAIKPERGSIMLTPFSPDEQFVLSTRARIDRHDPLLIECVEKLGNKANGLYSDLRVVEIPDGVDYEIAEYDGNEHIAEKHRTWS